MHRSRPAAAALAAAALAVAAGAASALDLTRIEYQNGGNACTGALPSYEGAFRKRPLEIKNEGTTSAFATCSTPTEETARRATFAGVRAQNHAAAGVSMSCTLVIGSYYESSSIAYFPKTLTVPANGFARFDWTPESGNPTFGGRTVSFSCNVPPGVGIAHVTKQFAEPVGQ